MVGAQMLRRSWLSSALGLALVLWICTIPILMILALPFMGPARTWMVAGILLVMYLVVCSILWPRETTWLWNRRKDE
jgi:hypothetical protein